VTVAGGIPTLSLNDGGTATYTGGSGSNALTFSYTVLAGQSTNDLTVTAFNLNGASVKDGLGNAASLAGAITNPQGKLKIYTGKQTVISTSTTTSGTTSLVSLGSNYALNTSGSTAVIGPELSYNGTPITAGQFGGWTVIAAVQTASGYDIAWKMSGSNEYTIWSTDSSGNYVSNLTPPVAGNSSTLESFEPIFQQDLNGDGVITIPAGQTMELTGSYSGEIVFGGSTGTLKIDHAADFTGTIGGPLTPTDHIDFADVNFNSVALGYSGNNSPGTLTVSDGTHTASLAVLGNHSLANFTASSDGHGGTIVVDPPLTGEAGGSLDQQVALFSQYMASAFPAGAGAASSLVDTSESAIGMAPHLASSTPSQQHAAMLS
jgi:Tryptophan-rich Synechocystis species C-terminal domain